MLFNGSNTLNYLRRGSPNDHLCHFSPKTGHSSFNFDKILKVFPICIYIYIYIRKIYPTHDGQACFSTDQNMLANLVYGDLTTTFERITQDHLYQIILKLDQLFFNMTFIVNPHIILHGMEIFEQH